MDPSCWRLGRTFGHFAAFLPPMVQFLHPLLHMPLYRCIFHGFWDPRGYPNILSAARRSTSGAVVKLHVAPLGDALAWVSARFAISEACEAV